MDKSIAEAELRLGDATLAVLKHAGEENRLQRLELRVDAGEDWYDGLLNIVVRVPENVTVVATTVFGDIHIEKTNGPVQSHTVSGAISVEDLGESVHLQSVSGDIKAARVKGPIRMKSVSGLIMLDGTREGGELQSVSGHISAKEIGGAWTFNNTSGDIRLENGSEITTLTLNNVSGATEFSGVGGTVSSSSMSGRIIGTELKSATLQVNSKSGEIDCGFASHVDGTVSASTFSGAATLSFPAGSSYRYTLETQSGAIEETTGGKEEAITKTLRTGVVGKGKGVVNIHTLSGAILLKTAAEI